MQKIYLIKNERWVIYLGSLLNLYIYIYIYISHRVKWYTILAAAFRTLNRKLYIAEVVSDRLDELYHSIWNC